MIAFIILIVGFLCIVIYDYIRVWTSYRQKQKERAHFESEVLRLLSNIEFNTSFLLNLPSNIEFKVKEK